MYANLKKTVVDIHPDQLLNFYDENIFAAKCLPEEQSFICNTSCT